MNSGSAYGLKNSRIYIVDIVGHCVPLRTKTRVTVIYYVDGRDSLLDKFLMIIGDSAAHHQGKHGTVTAAAAAARNASSSSGAASREKILGRNRASRAPTMSRRMAFSGR